MPPTERTPLTRATDSPDYVEFASLLRTRRSRIRQFQCCICAAFIAVFTMALIVTVSYSVSHDTIDTTPNLTTQTTGPTGNLSSPLKLGVALGSGSYTLFNNIANVPSAKSFVVSTAGMNTSGINLREDEIREGLEAGRLAIEQRLSADAIALASPLPSPSPESRHRYAVSTCACVGSLALAAVGELAATKKIEGTRSILGEPSAIGSFFDGNWLPKGNCKELEMFNCSVSKYRTFDGTCNRPMQWGATMTPYRRVLPPSYADGLQEPRRALSGKELPSARELSLKVHKPSPSSNPAFTVMLAVYGQFLDHDITATAISQGINGTSLSCCPQTYQHPECFPVRTAVGDPVFDIVGRNCMNFVRSAPAPQCKLGPRQQLNQVTAFIDASAVYGSDPVAARDLREFVGGRLRMQLTPDNRTLLPSSTNPNDGCNRETERLRGRYCFAAGDARANENLHLTTMHLLWARQHNKVANELTKVNPSWDDETLYQEARRIVGAQMQHITYEEFVPIVIGEQEVSMRGLRPLKTGYRQWAENPNELNNNPSIANSFAASAFRFAHTLLPGLMMVTDAQKGTSSYVELHRMLFNPYSLYSEGGVKSSVTSATNNVIQMTSTHVTSQLTAHLFEDPIGNTTVPCGLDLVSLNIQRGRDHGLPGYTSWREYCGLGKVESFAGLEGHLDPQVLQQISMLYESVHDVDLYSGALAEIPKSGSIVGPTFTCLIADQFARLQRGDRFWYEVPNQPHSFTESQLDELRKSSLAAIICGCSDGVTQTQAEVMRSIGPNNPMMSCEDIPRMSFQAWKDDTMANRPTLMAATPTAFDWMGLKNNINGSVSDILTYINSTISSGTPATTDWLEFRNYINSSFNDLRNQLNILHPPKPVESLRPSEKMAMNDDSFILRAAAPPSIAQDWINFKADLIKSLNNSVGMMGPGPVDPTKWIAFKQNIINQITDLKGQVSTMTNELAPKLLMEKYKQEQAEMNKNNLMPQNKVVRESAVPVGAIFDWKNFKDDTIQSLDNAILDIGKNMPAPDDPAWATFGADIKDRFSALRDKINMDRSTPPTELASDPKLMPSQRAVERTPFGNFNIPTLMATKDTTNTVTNFTLDWLEFQNKINDSLTHIIGDLNSTKPAPLDTLGWMVFKNTTKDHFAQFKNDIIKIKGEWVAKIKNVTGTTTAMPKTLVQAAGGFNKFDKTVNPFIPTTDWKDFKQQINDTLMNLINDAKNVKEIDMAAIQAEFNESFVELKNEIASLKTTILQSINTTDETTSRTVSPADYWKARTEKWSSFQADLNSTINDLLNGLKNESKATISEVMKILFQTKDKVAALDPPEFYPMAVQPVDWAQFIAGVNKTVADSLKTVSNMKTSTLMVKAGEPQVSSAGKSFLSFFLLILPVTTVAYCNTHLPTLKIPVVS